MPLLFSGAFFDGAGAPGGGISPSLSLVGSHDFGVTATDTVDIVVTGASELVLVLDGVNAPGVYGIQLSKDGGTSFYSVSGDYLVTRVDDGTADKDVSAETMILWGAAKSSTYQVMRLFALATSQPAHAFATGNSMRGTGRGIMAAHTRIDLVGAFDALRLHCPTGNFTAGEFLVYKKV